MYLRTVCVTFVLAHCTVIHSGYVLVNLELESVVFKYYFCSGVFIEPV